MTSGQWKCMGRSRKYSLDGGCDLSGLCQEGTSMKRRWYTQASLQRTREMGDERGQDAVSPRAIVRV